MAENTKIEPEDCEYTNEVVCPYCGHEYEESYEFFQKSDEPRTIDCENCEKTFYAARDVFVYYTTRKEK
jgi:transcription elongation factor Elf1